MNLLLVVGSSRSGTTMTARILGRSGLVKTFEELHYVDDIIPAESLGRPLSHQAAERAWALLEWRYNNGLFKRAPLDLLRKRSGRTPSREGGLFRPETGAALLMRFLSAHNDKPDARYVCEQTPRNLQYVQRFSTALPDVYTVCPIRDPRDVLLSQKNRWRRRQLGGRGYSNFGLVRSWINYQPVLLSLMWRRDAKLAAGFVQGSSRFYRFRFEDLVASPAQVVRRICSFLNIPFEDELLSIPMRGSSISPDTDDETGIRHTVTGRWVQGLTKQEVWICERIAGRTMRDNGYYLSNTRPTPVGLFWLTVSSLVRLPFMLPANIRQMRAALANRRFQARSGNQVVRRGGVA